MSDRKIYDADNIKITFNDVEVTGFGEAQDIQFKPKFPDKDWTGTVELTPNETTKEFLKQFKDIESERGE